MRSALQSSDAPRPPASLFLARRPRQYPSAFTLIEVLTTVAMLIIGLGLMVSLARYVRSASAEQFTRDLLSRLDVAMSQYIQRNDSQIPQIAPLRLNRSDVDEPELLRRARVNNEQFVRLLKSQRDLEEKVFSDLSLTYYDEVTLLDAWGTPIVFMPRMDPDIGMGPHEYFFFSAGPDRKFLTRDDNLYSYEQLGGGTNK